MAAALAVAVAQPATRGRDVAANARAHAEAVRAARARLVVFPELSLTGYELEAPAIGVDDPVLDPIVRACAETGSIALAGAPVAGGRRSIGALRIDAGGASVAYRKTHLGGDERASFTPGDGVAVHDVDGWHVAIGICKDTGVAAHVAAAAALEPDLYVAGLVHRPDELDEQDARGRHLAAACGAPVAFASFAGETGGGYAQTAGHSTIFSPAGTVLARAGAVPGEIAVAHLPR